MKKKKLALAAFTVAIMCLTAGCGAKTEENGEMNDFYGKVNSEWLSETKLTHGNFYYDTTKEQQDKVRQELDAHLQEMATKAEKGQKLTAEEQKAVLLYQQAEDWKKRNELSTEPVKEWLQRIEQAENREDVVEILKDEKFAYYNTLFSFRVNKDGSTGNYETYVIPESISGQTGMFTDAQFSQYQKLLKKEISMAGYAGKDAKIMAEHTIAVERNLLELTASNRRDYGKYANKGMTSVLNNLPLEEIAREQGYLENRTILICSASHLKFLQELFTEENIPVIKDYLLTSAIVKSAPYLDEDMAQQYEKARNAIAGGKGGDCKEYAGYQVVSGLMEDFLAEYYMQEYVGADMEQEIKEMSEEIRTTFRKNIAKAQWMSDSTREYAIKKLDAMELFVGLPEKLHDYQKVTVTSTEDGGNLLENMLEFYVSEKNFEKEFLQDQNEGSCYFHPLEVNAAYYPEYNAFAIHAAIIGFAQCGEDSSYEAKLASMGMVIAHEISHGFDGIGSEYTAEGVYQNWWKPEDKTAYRERLNKVKHYFDGMQVEKYTLVGENVMNEAYADLSAMSVCMSLLSEKSSSNYQEFFETYAKTYRSVVKSAWLEYLVNNDTHLPSKIRVNHIVNQMDEFYETYQVEETSPMYVAPEERLQVWE